MMPVTATYRLQLRDGVDFGAAAAWLPQLADLGISHLYLSPIFTAVPGSTHGYDVTDPGTIDASLGGPDGFAHLAAQAKDHGIGIVIDIVPNHMAFSLETPWLVDVLRHGPQSRYARHFDIDWDADRLILPFLPDPFEAMVEAGALARDGDVLVVGDTAVPLRPDGPDTDDIRELHAAQHWRLTHWARERDGVTHRRFFNVTGLIGMQVERSDVFDDLHRETFRLIDEGLVQGLRLDHVDGLADPTAYLVQLRARLPCTPIWVEKILTGDEVLPTDWPVDGTTGYEAGRALAQLLTYADGHADIVAQWRAASGHEETFHDALVTAKNEVIRQDLAAELHQLINLADTAVEGSRRAEPGQEALREAVLGLLVAFPRYRTYFAPGVRPPGDVLLMERVAAEAAADLRSPEVVDLLRDRITSPDAAAAQAFSVRFQQVTGALLAKAHEDTAGFRWNAYIAANEVGADPGEAVLDAAGFETFCAARPPLGLMLTSSHDTKRSEDARMRLVAMSHLPADWAALWSATLPLAPDVSANLRWYIVQAALAIWDADDEALGDRLRDHATKAMREAKEITNWTHPDAGAEAQALAFLDGLIATWRSDIPQGLAALMQRGEVLSLAQAALKLAMPGVPDIYRGCEGLHLALTDPDNRLPVDPAALQALSGAEGFAGDKARLTRAVLRLRRRQPGFFATATTRVTRTEDGIVTLVRADGQNRLTVHASLAGDAVPPGSVWPGEAAGATSSVSVDWH